MPGTKRTEELESSVVEAPSSAPRSRREKSSKLSATHNKFEELRKAREQGKKIKAEIPKIENVYDMVDDDEYAEIVRKRQDDDFIELDANGAPGEYYDDGREIFEEERTDAAIAKLMKEAKKSKGRSKGKNDIDKPEASKSRDIRDMLASSSAKVKHNKEPGAIELVNPSGMEALLAEINGETQPTKKPDSRYQVLYGKKPNSSSAVEESSAPAPFSQSSNGRKKTNFRQVIKEDILVTSFKEEPISQVEDGSLRNAPKRPVPESPVKSVETAEQVRARIAAPKVISFSVNREKAEPAKKARPDIPEIKMEPADDPSFSDSFLPDDGEDDIFADIITEAPNAYRKSGLSSQKLLNEVPGLTAKFGAMTNESLHAATNLNEFEDMDLSEFFDEESSVLRMYWLDACEDAIAQPGTVFLFGKCKQGNELVSVCVRVNNIERRQYLLIREKKFDWDEETETDEPVEEEDVRKEFETNLRHKLKITRFRSAAAEKSYAFEKVDVPDKAKYLEIRYPFTAPPIPEDYKATTFSTVFGRTTSALEIFILDRKLKGPCWLDISKTQPSTSRFSWCKTEYVVDVPSSVQVVEGTSPMEPPPVVVMGLQLRSVVNSRTKQNEIVTAAALVHQRYPLNRRPTSNQFFTTSFVGVSHPSEVSFPYGFKEDVGKENRWKTEIAINERSLISQFLAYIQRIDPDFIVFHEAVGQQLDILLDRAVKLNVQNWSRLGRLKRGHVPKGRFGPQIVAFGRIICDVKHSAQEHVHAKSYDLSQLQAILLKDDKVPRVEIPNDSIKEYFRTSDSLLFLIEHAQMDALYCLRLMTEMNALPLALQITQIAGNILSRTLLGGRSERNEYLLLHAFTEKGYICPDKTFKDFLKKASDSQKKKDNVKEEEEEDVQNEVVDALAEEELAVEGEVVPNAAQAPTTGKRKPAYAGGLVLEPKKGLYDTVVLLMDFNSLYPSIIQEYNICFTTIPREAYKMEGIIPALPPSDLESGILPKVISNLIERRKVVKNLLKDPKLREDQRMQYDIRQKGLKLTANSLYGCLGFANSRFFARHLAALITSQGREILMVTKEKIEKGGHDVIYGDTDSLMINTRSSDVNEVLAVGYKIKQDVSRIYKCLELDVDGIFRSMLLLNKKKYAALLATKQPDGTFKYSTEIKGLDVVRRDWSKIAADTGIYVIDQILAVASQTRDLTVGNIQAKLQEVAARINEDRCTIEELTITKQLTKDPALYSDVKSNPHVQIARRLNGLAKSSRKFRAGDTIAYVICNEVPDASICAPSQRVPHTARGYHIEEYAKSNGQLTIDKQYYLAEQVHKVVNRLCEPIEGVDSAFIAECLGVDKAQFPHHFSNPNAEEEDGMGAVPDEELYKNCLSLELPCTSCGEKWEFRDPIWEKDGQQFFSLSKCLNCDEAPVAHISRIRNHLRIQIGIVIQQYYKMKLICDDVNCHASCSFMPPKFHRGKPVCPFCDKSIMKADFSDRDLYLQLCFWKHAFDPDRALEKIKKKPSYGSLFAVLKNSLELRESYSYLAEYIQTFLDKSDYGKVKFSDFFHHSTGFEVFKIKTEF